MNILFFNERFGIGGGVESYLRIVAGELEALGFKVIRVSLKERNDCIHLGTMSRFPNYFCDPLFENSLVKLVGRLGVDVIHINFLSPNVASSMARAVSKVKVGSILTVHNYIYLCPTETMVKMFNNEPCDQPWFNTNCVKCLSVRNLMRRRSGKLPLDLTYTIFAEEALRGLLKKVDVVISPSRNFKAMLRGFLGIDPMYLPNPIPRALLLRQPNCGGDGSVLFIGRLVPEKGLTLLPVIAKMLDPKVKLHVVGKGPLQEWLKRYKIGNMVYHGFFSEDKKVELLRNSSIVIVPSICRDMFNYVVSEAFASCKPVVAFGIGGPKEQVEASGGGLLAKPFDIKDFAEKVNYLLQNPSEAKKMGLSGRKWVEKNLHPSHYGKALAKVYYDAINGV